MIYFILPILLCWGSFLNYVAYRLVHNTSFKKLRSICPKCNNEIAWYDLVPLFSWLALNGKCRSCKKTISLLYPAIEIATVIIGLGIFYLIHPTYYFAYFIFASALLITIRTDLETMLISRFTTLFLIPIAFAISLNFYTQNPFLPINLLSSIKGALFGYFILFLVNKIFYILTRKNGMGQGDLDLLALIGAFTGITGAWISLTIGAFTGSLAGLILIYTKGNQLGSKIPFGPFLSIGAITFILFQNELLKIIFC